MLLFAVFLVFFVALVIFQLSFWLILFAVLLQFTYIAISQRQLMGNSLLVSSKQFPDLYNISKDNANDLGIHMPRIFISQDPYLNAYTIGFKKPYSIVLNSALVESLTKDELDFVIGHEMGHIKFGHSRMLSFISPIGKDIPFISWLSSSWQRRAEYTADRAGLVLTGRIRPALTAIIKMSIGQKLATLIDINEVIKQISKGRKGLMSKVGEFMLTHPYSTNRIRALVEFCFFSGYFDVSSYLGEQKR